MSLFGLDLRLGLGIRASSMVKVRVKVRFQIRLYDFVSDSDHSQNKIHDETTNLLLGM